MKQWRMVLALVGLGLGAGLGVYIGAQDGPGPDPGPGLKHQRVTTGSIDAAMSAAVTLTWTSAFADTNYTVDCSVIDATAAILALEVDHIQSASASAVVVRVSNDSAGALTGTLGCMAMHD